MIQHNVSFVFTGCSFLWAPSKMKDKLPIETLISFKGLSEVYICSLPPPGCQITTDGLTYGHQNVFYFMACSQAWRDLVGSRCNHRLLFLGVVCIHLKMKWDLIILQLGLRDFACRSLLLSLLLLLVVVVVVLPRLFLKYYFCFSIFWEKSVAVLM